jgi:hypothetical protein
MTITLTAGSTVITLHPDLLWSDEFSWNPVAQTKQPTITGAIVVSSSLLLAGRPFTLQPIDEGSAWMSRSTVLALRNFAAEAGTEMTLRLRGVDYPVILRFEDGAAIEAVPVVHYSDADDADWYLVTLRFTGI